MIIIPKINFFIRALETNSNKLPKPSSYDANSSGYIFTSCKALEYLYWIDARIIVYSPCEYHSQLKNQGGWIDQGTGSLEHSKRSWTKFPQQSLVRHHFDQWSR